MEVVSYNTDNERIKCKRIWFELASEGNGQPYPNLKVFSLAVKSLCHRSKNLKTEI